jgi:MFS family permease
LDVAKPGGSAVVSFVSKHFFYGWVIVAAGFLAQSFTAISAQGLATYVQPFARDFGWNAAQTATGRAFQQSDAFLGPVNGWLVDRFGARRVMTAGVILYGLSFALFSQIDSLVAFYGACLTMAVANGLIGLLVVSSSVNQWFRRKRSRALSIAVAGFCVAGAFGIPAIVWAQAEFGWRTAALATGTVILILGLPVALLMRDAPERYGLQVDGRPVDHHGQARHVDHGFDFTFRQAVRTRTFWFIAAGWTLVLTAHTPFMIHYFPYLEGLLDRETAALLMSSLNAFNFVGRMTGGLIADRYEKRTVLGVMLAGSAASVVLLVLASSLLPLLIAGALYGFTWGGRTVAMNSLQGEYFGRKSYGKIVGFTAALASVPSMSSPILVGIGFDLLGDYRFSFLVLAGLAAGAAVFFLLAFAPARPVTVPAS